MQTDKHIFPIIIKKCKAISPLAVSNDISITEMTKDERLELFGLESINFEFREIPDQTDGWLNVRDYSFSSKIDGKYPAKKYLGFLDFDKLFVSNYLVIVDVKNEESTYFAIHALNTAFSLYQPTSTKAYMYFMHKQPQTRGIHPEGLPYGPCDYISFDDDGFKEIKEMNNLKFSGLKNPATSG